MPIAPAPRQESGSWGWLWNVTHYLIWTIRDVADFQLSLRVPFPPPEFSKGAEGLRFSGADVFDFWLAWPQIVSLQRGGEDVRGLFHWNEIADLLTRRHRKVFAPERGLAQRRPKT